VDLAEREAVAKRAAAFKRLHDERAAALAQSEWDRVVAAAPEGFKDLYDESVGAVFRECIKHAYYAALKACLEEARAAVDDVTERRHLREAGRDPDKKN